MPNMIGHKLNAYRLYGKPIPLEEFHDIILERSTYFNDIKCIKARRIHMDDKGRIEITIPGKIKDNDGGNIEGPFGLQDLALGLLCRKFKIPANYMHKCPPALRARNINHWIKNGPTKELYIRFDSISGDPEIRAILSKHYAPFDNHQVSEKIAHIGKGRDLNVRFEWTHNKLCGQIIAAKSKLTTKNGQVIHGGAHFRNSEVGISKCSFSGFAGLVAGDGGIIFQENQEFNKTHMKKDSIMLGFDDAVRNILDNINEDLKRYADLQNIRVREPLQLIETIYKSYILNEPQQEEIKIAAKQQALKGKWTMWDIVNAISGAGVSEKLTLDERERLQKIGGEICYNIKKYNVWIK